jgi:hypothetical protein
MRPFHLPNVPVTPLPKIPARPIPSVKVSKTGEHAPKTKPIYGMARPYVACIHGMKGPYVEH